MHNDVMIGLSGKAGSGKDLVADYLASNFCFSQFALALPIKSLLKSAVGLSVAHVDGEFKEAEILAAHKSPRQMMQHTGDWLRHWFGDDVLMQILSRRLTHCRENVANCGGGEFNVVVSDVRTNVEAEWIRAQGGVMLHLFRPDAEPVADHVTEHGVALHHDDFQICNDDSVDVLFKKIDDVVINVLGVERLPDAGRAQYRSVDNLLGAA